MQGPQKGRTLVEGSHKGNDRFLGGGGFGHLLDGFSTTPPGVTVAGSSE